MPEVAFESPEEEFDPAVLDADVEEPEEEPEEEEEEEKEDKRHSPLTKVRREEEQSLHDWIKETAGGASAVQVKVYRVSPKRWKNISVDGMIETHEELLTEEQIKEMYGGGKYRLQVMLPNKSGGWRYGAQKTVVISGPMEPPVGYEDHDEERRRSPASDEPTPLAQNAMKMAAENTRRAEERAERLEKEIRQSQNQHNPAIDMMLEELRGMKQTIADKDRQIMELYTKPKDNPTDQLFGKMLEGESSRIQAIQIQHQSEVNAMRERHNSDIERIHANYKDQVQWAARTHEREIDNLKASNQATIDNLKLSYEGQIQGLQREINSLDRQLTESRSELATLKSTKDKSTLQQIQEFAALKEAVQSLGGDNDEGSGSMIERVVGQLTNSTLAEGIAQRLGSVPQVAGAQPQPPGQPAGPPPSPEQQLAAHMAQFPANQPVRIGEDVYVRRESGEIKKLQHKKKDAVSKEELVIAAEFLAAAYTKEQDPEQLGTTIRSAGILPDNLVAYLRTQGADALLTAIEEIKSESPLLTQGGRNWTRKVAKIVLE